MPNIATNAILNTNRELYNRECYRKMVDTFNEKCFNLSKMIGKVLSNNWTAIALNISAVNLTANLN
ncbi:unnamed protein product, partial [Oppiella nova]